MPKISIPRHTGRSLLANPTNALPNAEGVAVLLLLTFLLFACGTPHMARMDNEVHSILDYGAVADGTTLCTAAFDQAIAACVRGGGGTVLIPAGEYLTGAIHLKSNVTLHVEAGATVRFSQDFDHYPTVPTRYEGFVGYGYSPLIYACRQENVAITGKGTFDGQGKAWWDEFARIKREKELHPASPRRREFWLKNGKPTTETHPDAFTGWHSQFMRPPLVQFYECRRVRIEGPTFTNSPFWTVHPVFCDDLVIRDIHCKNPSSSPNTDALDLDSCRKVVVEGCTFDVGDDCVVLKSGKNEDGRRVGRPTEDVEIRDCTMYAGHGGVVIGSEMSGDVRRVLAENCRFIGTDKGIRLKTRRGRGGVVEDIVFRDIEMKDIRGDAIVVNSFYFTKPTEEIPPEDEGTPRIRRVRIENVRCNGARRAGYIRGLPEMPLEDITLYRVELKARDGLLCQDATDVQLRGLKLFNEKGSAVVCKHVTGLHLLGLWGMKAYTDAPMVEFADVRQARVRNCAAPPGSGVFLYVREETSAGIRLFANDLSVAEKPYETDGDVPENAVRIESPSRKPL